jgi:hypothetical protein
MDLEYAARNHHMPGLFPVVVSFHQKVDPGLGARKHPALGPNLAIPYLAEKLYVSSFHKTSMNREA